MIRQKVFLAETKIEDSEKGLIRAVVSTESEDRDGDIIRASGWELEHFRRNPILVSSHNYMQLRSIIGEWVEMVVRGKRLEGLARYYVGEGNEEADWGFKLASRGRAAYSVGFIPIKSVARSEGGHEFMEQELLEVSHVVVPSNRDALQVMARSAGTLPVVAEMCSDLLSEIVNKAGRIMSQANLDKLHRVMDMVSDIHTGVCDMGEDCPLKKNTGFVILKSVPDDVSRQMADEGETWEAPRLSDFTGESWDSLSDSQKRRIAGHFAWAESMPPDTYGSLKLPHHRPSDGKVVWRGVAAAMAVLLGARGGVDIPDVDRSRVHGHLAAHYRQFDKEVPELRTFVPESRREERVAQILDMELEED